MWPCSKARTIVCTFFVAIRHSAYGKFSASQSTAQNTKQNMKQNAVRENFVIVALVLALCLRNRFSFSTDVCPWPAGVLPDISWHITIERYEQKLICGNGEAKKHATLCRLNCLWCNNNNNNKIIDWSGFPTETGSSFRLIMAIYNFYILPLPFGCRQLALNHFRHIAQQRYNTW